MQDTYDRYWQKGWAVVENVFTPDEVERAAQIAIEIRRQRTGARRRQLRGGSGRGRGRCAAQDQRAVPERSGVSSAGSRSPLTDIIRGLIGVEPLLMTDQILMKPPHFGTAKPYHQDNFHFKCRPADHTITAWIAMDDVDEGNGCLRYIEGSHKGRRYRTRPPIRTSRTTWCRRQHIDLSKEAPAVVNKSGVVFHHSWTLHTSHRNESERWRRGYATHWVSAETESENDSIKTAYLNRDGAR